MLSVRNLNTYYGGAHILADVSLEIGAGEVVVLLGRNGAGECAGPAGVLQFPAFQYVGLHSRI